MSDKKYYRPLPDNLTIDEAKWLSEITRKRQLGLFAADDISQDEYLGTTHYVDERGEGGLIRTPLGGFYNHSETPNCMLVKQENEYFLITIKEVLSGEELTCKYTMYDPTK